VTGKPQMRVARIDLDDDEMPDTVYLRMTWDVMDRLCRDRKAIRDGRFIRSHSGEWWSTQFPMSWVAQTARWYHGEDDAVAKEIRDCLSSLCNRFWDGGVREAVEKVA
jgi:hypothetical protein